MLRQPPDQATPGTKQNKWSDGSKGRPQFPIETWAENSMPAPPTWQICLTQPVIRMRMRLDVCFREKMFSSRCLLRLPPAHTPENV